MNDSSSGAIGVFDSGVGGLTAVKELHRLMPNENIVYLGDTARVPYGTKSKETIRKYALQDIEFLKKYDVKMYIVACGTVSAVMTTSPVFDGEKLYTGVLLPAVQAACAATKNKRIGVIATSATVKSGSYGKAIRAIIPDAKVVGKACPMFVPLVENGYTSKDCTVTRLIAEEYLEVMKKEQVDTLILGCTHYPLLSDIIADIMGENVKLISSGAEAAKYAQAVLTENNLLSDRKENGWLKLFCTDSAEMFSENVETFLGKSTDYTVESCMIDSAE